MTGPFLGCITEAAASGEIEPGVAEEARATYEAAFEAASSTLGPDEADRAAAKATLSALERADLEARRRRLLQIRTRQRILDGVADLAERRGYTGVSRWWRGGGDPPDGGAVLGGGPPKDGPFRKGGVFARALPLLMRNKPGLSGAPFASVEGRLLAIRGMFDARMAGLIEKFQSGVDANLVHQRGRALLQNVVREAFGERTGDASAAELAKAWGETAEEARRMFNAAGGAIGKLEGWGLPQSHDAAKLYAAGKPAWLDAITPLLDRSKMIDSATGAAFTDKRLRFVLSQVYDTIVTHGLIDRAPGEPVGQGMVANRRAEARFLAFKDADSWSRYQGQFGQGDAYAAMLHHLDGMAHDVALMQILGPNPAHEFDWLVKAATREAAIEKLGGVADADSRARQDVHLAQNMMDAYTGQANLPDNERLARLAAGARSYLNAVDLGAAILTDMPSAPFFGAMARRFMGLHGDLGQLTALLADPGMRAVARRMDFINDVARDGLAGVTQDSLRLLTVGAKADEGMNAFARRLPTAVMRLQGLEGAFEARKRSFRLSFMGALADAAGKPLADLHAAGGAERMLATELEARGFSEDDWAKIGSATPWEPRPGATFLRPREIAAAAGEDLALRVGEMVLNAEQMAVPVSGSLWSRAALMGGARPGTWKGEALRSLLMYRTFVVNVVHLYGEEVFLRGVRNGLTGPGLAGYMGAWGAGIFGMMTLTGALSVQLKQIASGKDPLAMNTPQFWGAAMLQGGGLGLLGDFLFSKHARNDKSGPVAGFGPVGEAVDDAWQTTGGFAQSLLDKHAQRHALHREAMQIGHDVRSYTPGASLWWARTAFNRDVVEQLEQLIDPEAKRSFARQARQMQLESGQSSWWPAGQLGPQRAPDLGAALGPQPRPTALPAD